MSRSDNKIAWYVNSGLGGSAAFTGPQLIVTSSATYPLGFQVTDVDADGDVDVAVVSNTLGSLSWFENTVGVQAATGGDPATSSLFVPTPFAISSPPGQLNHPDGVALGDINNDGYLDAIAADYYNSQLTWFPSNPGNASAVPSAARFSHVEYGVGSISSPLSVWLADFDSDGHLDALGGTLHPKLCEPPVLVALCCRFGAQAGFAAPGTTPAIRSRNAMQVP